MENTGTAGEKLSIPYPPETIFENRNVADTMLGEGTPTFMLDHFEYPSSGGILVHIQGAKFPKKGFPFPEGVWAINLAKKFFVALLKILTIPAMLGWLLIVFIPHKKKIKVLNEILNQYNRLAEGAIAPFMVKEEYMTPASREIGRFVFNFLATLGVYSDTAYVTGKIFANIVEYDDAYRYRLEDIMAETTITKLYLNPRKEFLRLLDILISRENPGDVIFKVKKLRKLLSVFFRLPKVRKALQNTVLHMTLENLQPDEPDKYWMNMRGDYNFGGIPFKDRNVDLVPSYQIKL